MLPTDQTSHWPPKWIDPAEDQWEIWSAWWSSDLAALQAHYGAATDSMPRPAAARSFFGSDSGIGPVVKRVFGSLRRWMWGSTSRDGASTPVRLHEPFAATVAATDAAELFSQPIIVRHENPAAAERLAAIDDERLHALLLEAAERASATGGVYLRLVWGVPGRTEPDITILTQDQVVPEWSWDRLAAATAHRELPRLPGDRDGDVWRHLERHTVEPQMDPQTGQPVPGALPVGQVQHALYLGEDEQIGQRMPLAAHPATAGLADVVLTGSTRMTVVYVPNRRPNRLWHCPELAPFGRADISQAEQLLDFLDLAWSSLNRDVEQGRGRLIVPSSYLERLGEGKGTLFDVEREIFTPLEGVMGAETGQMQITSVQLQIRVTDHVGLIDAIKRAIIEAVGHDPATFGMSDPNGSSMTATEVNAKRTRSATTRAVKIGSWRVQLVDLLAAWLDVGAAAYQWSTAGLPGPTIEWPSLVGVDGLKTAQEIQALSAAEAISDEEKVRMRKPGWDDQQVAKEVAAIAVTYGKAQPPLPADLPPVG